ncbi:hypothetical protein, partial [Moorena sp. SIO4E2]|uniref:hypothetical protein n=1 Tax=Moorena sp. SIO4E2 TaxID=2607826 RepID=UPI0025795293
GCSGSGTRRGPRPRRPPGRGAPVCRARLAPGTRPERPEPDLANLIRQGQAHLSEFWAVLDDFSIIHDLSL